MSRTKSESKNKKKKTPSSSIPTVLTSFIGRKHELAEIEQLLKSSRVLTLTGAAGCGKTRLALRVATEINDQYEDGIHWVELARLTNDQLIPKTVARVLSVAGKSTHPLMDELLDVLQNKRLLLVLDNCEHLLSACTQLVETLIQAPAIHILATSREPLRAMGERLYPVTPMTLPPPRLSVTDLNQFDAIQLFVERARASLPNFALTSNNSDVVTRICHQLD